MATLLLSQRIASTSESNAGSPILDNAVKASVTG
jgi:hypothetical protein